MLFKERRRRRRRKLDAWFMADQCGQFSQVPGVGGSVVAWCGFHDRPYATCMLFYVNGSLGK